MTYFYFKNLSEDVVTTFKLLLNPSKSNSIHELASSEFFFLFFRFNQSKIRAFVEKHQQYFRDKIKVNTFYIVKILDISMTTIIINKKKKVNQI